MRQSALVRERSVGATLFRAILRSQTPLQGPQYEALMRMAARARPQSQLLDLSPLRDVLASVRARRIAVTPELARPLFAAAARAIGSGAAEQRDEAIVLVKEVVDIVRSSGKLDAVCPGPIPFSWPQICPWP